ncbi:TetR/AcrR family transcriptional regulator [Algivirga pacifica]|uniref:HTH tetR-type domain-containing protein n=1 Tax=Algivirga pacifica TaxID=1162670 RepID=A0ABP9D905_9BACT
MKNTKEKIVKGAIELLSHTPSASMEEIGTAINLSRRTLHRYFGSKAELIEEITRYASHLWLEKTREAVVSFNTPIEQLKAMFRNDINSGYQFRFLYHYKDSIQTKEEEASDLKEMMKLFRELLKTLQEEKVLSSAYSLVWVERFYLSTVDAATSLIHEDQSNKEEVLQMAWTSFLNGITV